MNQLVLRGRLMQREALRYSPAGVAVVETVFHHDDEVIEAGTSRRVRFELEAIALGAIALKLEALELGCTARLTGFLATRSQRTRKLRMHITDFEVIKD